MHRKRGKGLTVYVECLINAAERDAMGIDGISSYLFGRLYVSR